MLFLKELEFMLDYPVFEISFTEGTWESSNLSPLISFTGE